MDTSNSSFGINCSCLYVNALNGISDIYCARSLFREVIVDATTSLGLSYDSLNFNLKKFSLLSIASNLTAIISG